ncbi:RHS repeat-associated core domain-containing protein [Pseudomonas sp. NFACC23-1]|uniref:RHS repeat-associated core domain-containing protein n=1 Tax=unclassified Pseudomonas TaxID=196821 RepID=UPI0008903077|nr:MULTISPECIES: RHS repeat-associated core domain-containing protein [unclassified Pseudomonas]SDB43449.1 RHS repeat-associated core domain-containing protein [Pseudomonas sp. NFACC17-2]SEJ07746.1 RHS repeat-associated core domain-containing protein [Pseudomonas sp. NFACC23-1]SFW42513.1 RHS repeat-associated core domain-containing protein [Pseudomonas sp. NFACC16-2]
MADSDLGSNHPITNFGASPDEPTTRFHYDALDSLIGRTTSEGKEHRFYRNNELASEVSGTVSTTFVRAEGVVLAERQTGGDASSILLMGDDKNSVMGEVTRQGLTSIAYSPYGHRVEGSSANSHLGYNGERRERQTGWYLLGKGYRVFNPQLMRFHSPDNLSPFGKGGLNAYMYCEGDPINNVDPTGHVFFGKLPVFFGVSSKPTTAVDLATLTDVRPSFLRGVMGEGGVVEVHDISSRRIKMLGTRVRFYRELANFELADYITRRLLGGPGSDLTLASYVNRTKILESAVKDFEYAVANKNRPAFTSESLRDFKVVAKAYKKGVAFVSESKQQRYFSKRKIGEEEMKNIRGKV